MNDKPHDETANGGDRKATCPMCGDWHGYKCNLPIHLAGGSDTGSVPPCDGNAESDPRPVTDGGRVVSPRRRDHDTYLNSDRWTVVDIESVDRLFLAGPHGAGELRIDIDGRAARSDGIGDAGDAINTSIWLDESRARDLYHRLAEVFGDE